MKGQLLYDTAHVKQRGLRAMLKAVPTLAAAHLITITLTSESHCL